MKSPKEAPFTWYILPGKPGMEMEGIDNLYYVVNLSSYTANIHILIEIEAAILIQ